MKNFTLFLVILILALHASGQEKRQRYHTNMVPEFLIQMPEQSQATLLSWSVATSKWLSATQTVMKSTYTHKLDSVWTLYMDPDTDTWDLEDVDIFLYDDEWRPTTIIEKEWDFDREEWEIYSSTEFSYNDKGLVSQMIISYLEDEGEPLVPSSKVEIYYDQQNRVDHMFMYSTDDDKSWVLMGKQYFFYNAQGLLTLVDMMIYNDEEDEWLVFMKTKFTYDGAGRRLTTGIYLAAGEFAEDDMLISLTEYSYDQAGRVIRSEMSALNFDTFQVQLTDKTEYDYDNDGDVTIITGFERDAETWVPDYKEELFYFADLNFANVAYAYAAYSGIYASMDDVISTFHKTLKETIGYGYYDGEFYLYDKTVHYYSPTSDVAEEFTLTYQAGNHGKVVGETTQVVARGGSGSEVEAVPDDGYHFDEWSDGVQTAKRTDSNVTRNINVTAFFAANTYTIQASVNNQSLGSVSGGGEYLHGQTATLVAIPNNAEVHLFMNWTENGNVVYEQAEYTFPVTSNRTLTANFQDVTAVNSQVQRPVINAYPNPARNILVVESAKTIQTIAVFDTSRRQLTFVTANGTRHELDTSSLEAGIYLLRVTTANGVATTPFVIE